MRCPWHYAFHCDHQSAICVYVVVHKASRIYQGLSSVDFDQDIVDLIEYSRIVLFHFKCRYMTGLMLEKCVACDVSLIQHKFRKKVTILVSSSTYIGSNAVVAFVVF